MLIIFVKQFIITSKILKYTCTHFRHVHMLLYFRISLPQSSHIPNQTHMPTSYLAPMVLNLSSKHKINLYIFNHFSTLRWQRYLKFYLMEDKDLFILHSQYQGCWWPGYLRSQGISSKGIKLVLPECYGFSTRKVNTLRPRQNGRHFPDDTFKRIFLNENVRISIKFSLKFVPKGPFNNNPELVQIMAWRRSGDKPLSEPMMVSLLTHICVTRPQWVNSLMSIVGETSNK